MKQRLLLCVLTVLALLYIAMPRLSFSGESVAATAFAWAWLGFALVVLIGNLVGLLYTKKTVQVKVDSPPLSQAKPRARRYYDR